MLILGGVIAAVILLLLLSGLLAAIITWLALKWFVIVCAIAGGVVGAMVFGERGGIFVGMLLGALAGIAALVAYSSSQSKK